ncbi:aspartate/glutamate racemase family protein [Candidatus Bipolaricaulota bacterium]
MIQAEKGSPSKAIGILGGMGPAATIEFFRRLVAATPAAVDQAHLRILIDNNPHVPDRTDAIFGRGPDPGPALADMARGLAASGADFLTMPCNTGHVFQAAIRNAVSIPFIDMIEETAHMIAVKRVGLLATTGTVRAELYRMACDQRDIELITPAEDDQRLVMDMILRIKAGGPGASVREHAAAIVGRLADRGAGAVIAGCTEISLIPGDGMPIEWIDALDCLVQASMRMALNQENESEESK